jgi:Cu-Zn family superoxide dismutase
MRIRLSLTAVAAVSLLAACAETGDAPTTPTSHLRARRAAGDLAGADAASHAVAELRNVDGDVIGTARFTEDATGAVHLTVHAKDVTPGLHGLHLHAVGACTPGTTTAFSSAGGHYNPTQKQHGHANPLGHHAGDLPNLEVNPAGVGHLSVALEQFSLAELADVDGTALVLHQNEDDRLTNAGLAGPGNSGARIACGIVTAR